MKAATIDKIKVKKTFYKREVDAFGNVERIPYEKFVPRKIELVNPGVRLGYFLVDLVLFYIIFVAVAVLFFVLVELTSTYHILKLVDSNFFGWTIFYGIYFLYYALGEYFFGGTLAKLIFGYRVIDSQAQKISFGKALLRSIIRFVPFEALSCIGERGWHDTWTNTYVVRKKEKIDLQKHLGSIKDETDILD